MTSLISIIAIGLLALAFMLWPLTQRRADKGLGVGIESDDVAELWEREKDRLVREQNDLDMALAEGKISDKVHREERQAVMAEAERALTRLRRARAQEEKLANQSGHKPKVYPMAGAGLAGLVLIGTLGLIFNLKGLDVHRAAKQTNTPQVTMEDIKRMVTSLEAKVQAGEGNAREKLMLARSYLVLGERAKSLALYNQIIEGDEQNVTALMSLGQIYFNSKDETEQKKARALFDQALKAEPDKPEALWFKSLSLVRARDFGAARVTLARLRDVAKDNKQAQDAIKRLLDELDKNTDPNSLKTDQNNKPLEKSKADKTMAN